MKITSLLASITCIGLGILPAVTAQAGEDAYIGEVFITVANYCPRSTAELDGKIMAISQNIALFSVLGTLYGGNGRTTFALPDLRGRSAVHTGQGPGLSSIRQGSHGGAESISLNSAGAAKKKGGSGEKLASSEQPLANRDPYLALRYCIVLQGTYPSRN